MSSFVEQPPASVEPESLALLSSDILTTPLRFREEDLRALRSSFTKEERVLDAETLSDETLARFLIARNGNTVKARALLVEHLAWRKVKLPLYKNSCITEFVKGKVYLHGFDREGHPLVVYRAKLQIPSDRNVEDMLNMCYWWAEKVISVLPPDKSKATILIDRIDAEMQNSDIEFVRAMASVFQNNYPERLYRAVVYPSGLVFYTVWNIIKWFLDPVTQHKVQPVLTLAGVTEFIDPKYIPVHMGGESSYSFDPEEFSDPAVGVSSSSSSSSSSS